MWLAIVNALIALGLWVHVKFVVPINHYGEAEPLVQVAWELGADVAARTTTQPDKHKWQHVEELLRAEKYRALSGYGFRFTDDPELVAVLVVNDGIEIDIRARGGACLHGRAKSDRPQP